MTSLTVRLADTAQTQSELQRKLGNIVDRLALQGLTSDPHVEPVFPGDNNVRWKGLFVVKVTDHGKEIAELLNATPGILQAYVAPDRR